MDFIQTTSSITSSNEISLLLGLLVTGMFYLQYKKYESEIEREDLIENFLKH